MVDLSESCGLGSCGINMSRFIGAIICHESPGKMFVLVCEMLTE